jgi:hypothetical protein
MECGTPYVRGQLEYQCQRATAGGHTVSSPVHVVSGVHPLHVGLKAPLYVGAIRRTAIARLPLRTVRLIRQRCHTQSRVRGRRRPEERGCGGEVLLLARTGTGTDTAGWECLRRAERKAHTLVCNDVFVRFSVQLPLRALEDRRHHLCTDIRL